MNLEFRRMEIDDLRAVYEIECDLFQDPWSYDSFLNDVRDQQAAWAYVVACDTEIAGYTVCWWYAGEVHIGNIAVSKKWQRRGIGSFILDQIDRHFKDTVLSYLEVRESNNAAIKLYQKHGFEILYIRKAYYSNGENALVMVKKHNVTRGEDGLV
jgi:ribosomal-protein-alanine N-acetyltransferase